MNSVTAGADGRSCLLSSILCIVYLLMGRLTLLFMLFAATDVGYLAPDVLTLEATIHKTTFA